MGVLGRLVSSVLLLLLLGCASSGGSRSASSSGALTQADLLESNEPYLYAAIERLRPRWLRVRGQDALGRTIVAQVFIDGSPRGELSILRRMEVVGVTDVRFLSAPDAATLYGTRAGIGGVILVRRSLR